MWFKIYDYIGRSTAKATWNVPSSTIATATSLITGRNTIAIERMQSITYYYENTASLIYSSGVS